MKKSKLIIKDPSLNLVLASQSPRRRELLTSAGYEFTVLHSKVSEIFDETLNPVEVARYLAELKARAVLDQHKELNSPGNLILGVDTIVCLDGRIFGKPRDYLEAGEFLRALSGRTHHVITGMALLKSSPTEVWTGVTESRVRFLDLTAGIIDRYVSTGEPMDKAGAYAIQGEGRGLVAEFEGSWSNIVGLPLETLDKILLERQWNVRRHDAPA